MPETISFKGPDYDDVKPHLWNYFEAVRSRKPVVEDAVFGHHAALACHMANESYFRQQAVRVGRSKQDDQELRRAEGWRCVPGSAQRR